MAFDEIAFMNDGGDHEAFIVGQVEGDQVTRSRDTWAKHGGSAEPQMEEPVAGSDIVDGADAWMCRFSATSRMARSRSSR